MTSCLIALLEDRALNEGYTLCMTAPRAEPNWGVGGGEAEKNGIDLLPLKVYPITNIIGKKSANTLYKQF